MPIRKEYLQEGMEMEIETSWDLESLSSVLSAQQLLDGLGQLLTLLGQLRGIRVDFRGVVESLIEFD